MSSWSGIDEFLAVAQTKNFGRAARALGCSTSQVSREVARLEDRTGLRLLHRTTRHVSLTDAGERLLLNLRRLVEERDEVLSTLIDEADHFQGLLRMTCSVAYGEQLVVPVVNALMTRHPKLHVDLLLTDEVLDLVEKGIDIAVRFGRLRDSRLIATRLGSRTLMLCAAPSYIDSHGAPKTLEDLADHQCLRGRNDVWIFSRDGQPYVHKPLGRMRCNSGNAVLDAALSGLGLCRLPDFYVQTAIERGQLVELLASHRPDDEGVWAVYPSRQHLPAKVRTVTRHLQEHLARGHLGGHDDSRAPGLQLPENRSTRLMD